MLKIIQKPCPNFRTGRSLNGVSYKPEAIVIHIMDGSLIGTDSWFNTPSSQVSAHYGIGKSGEIHQYVKEEDQAWHAGRVSVPSWKGIKSGINPNLYTIGIEHEGMPLKDDKWTPEMKEASAQLVADIAKRWNIALDRQHVIGHYEIFAAKPNCPALNKGVIDEIIARALVINGVDPMKADIKKAVELISQATAILKKYE